VNGRPTRDGTWHRLHPLSPVVRSGRGVLAVAVALAISRSANAGGGSRWLDLALPVAVAVAAVVSWLVTRWRLDGVTLRIESGLFRRDSRQLPVARIQAVDLVRPFLARALGLAELRVRLAGSSDADGRLAYLTEPAALELRARLLNSWDDFGDNMLRVLGIGEFTASAFLAPGTPAWFNGTRLVAQASDH